MFLHNSRNVIWRLERLHKSSIGVPVGCSTSLDRSQHGMAFINKCFACSFLWSITASILSCLCAVSCETFYFYCCVWRSWIKWLNRWYIWFCLRTHCDRFTKKLSCVSFFKSNIFCYNLSTYTSWVCRLQKWFCTALGLGS